MHTRNAYTVLGMRDPASPAWVPPERFLRARKRKLALWHPDKWKSNGLSDISEAERIYDVIDEALDRFNKYWKNPWIARRLYGEHGGLLLPMNSSVAHFSNDEANHRGIWGMLLDTVKAGCSPPTKHVKGSLFAIRVRTIADQNSPSND